MSRVAKAPVVIPAGVEVKIEGNKVSVKGAKGSVSCDVNKKVALKFENNELTFAPADNSMDANDQAGTTRALLNNIVHGVQHEFTKKLTIVGVGYRAQVKGKEVVLSLGYSNPVNYAIPEGIKIQTPSATEIVISGIDKNLVGQVAANIRSVRAPEPYKGKGVRYSDEVVHLKETKKK